MIEAAGIRRVATLARLTVTDEEAVQLVDELSSILSYVSQISSAELTEELPSMASAPLRADVPQPTDPALSLLSAPSLVDGQFAVAAVMVKDGE